MRFMRLIACFMQASFQEQAAYRANFWTSLFYSLLNLLTGVLGILVLFGRIENVQQVGDGASEEGAGDFKGFERQRVAIFGGFGDHARSGFFGLQRQAGFCPFLIRPS